MNDSMLVIIRGAGEVASGVAYHLFMEGISEIIMTETENPKVQRRTVSFGEAVYSDEMEIFGVTGKRAKGFTEALSLLENNAIPVVIDPACSLVEKVKNEVLVDGIMAKKNLGTSRDMAPLVVGLGPGFTADEDVDVVIETAEGDCCGDIIREGTAKPNTGISCSIGGYSNERVLWAPKDGTFRSCKAIGEPVEKGEAVGRVNGERLCAEISGTVRGLVRSGLQVSEGQKLGDIDPREIERFGISDRSFAIARGVYQVIKESAFAESRAQK